jgi:hypothetical protein
LCDLNNFDEIIGKTFLDAYIWTSSIMEASWEFMSKLALS